MSTHEDWSYISKPPMSPSDGSRHIGLDGRSYIAKHGAWILDESGPTEDQIKKYIANFFDTLDKEKAKSEYYDLLQDHCISDNDLSHYVVEFYGKHSPLVGDYYATYIRFLILSILRRYSYSPVNLLKIPTKNMRVDVEMTKKNLMENDDFTDIDKPIPSNLKSINEVAAYLHDIKVPWISLIHFVMYNREMEEYMNDYLGAEMNSMLAINLYLLYHLKLVNFDILMDMPYLE